MNDNNIIPMKLEQDLTVIQANELVRSKQDDLTLLEAKLIRLAIGQVLKNDTDLRTYSCKIVELADYLGINRNFIYREVDKLGNSLLSKKIYLVDKNGKNKRGEVNYKKFLWVDYIEYKDGIITFKLSESLKPYLIGLNKLFTMYGVSAVLDLPTNYSIRLYELIASYHNMIYEPYNKAEEVRISEDEFRFPIEQLRKWLNCEDKYPNGSNFIIRVIEPAVKAIQLKTALRISYRAEYKGRKITHIIFKLHSTFDRQYDSAIAQLREENN